LLNAARARIFCDIYALGKEQFTLKEMLGFYARKFNQDVSPVLYGLVYFDDAEANGCLKCCGM